MRTLDKYLKLPYTVTIKPDEDGAFIATIVELAGCVADGSSEAEAVTNLRSVQRAWIEDALEAGDPVPVPQEEEALPSGKWLQRVPRSLHKRLTAIARRENTSLNQLVAGMLIEATTIRDVIAETERTNHESWLEAHTPKHWVRKFHQQQPSRQLISSPLSWGWGHSLTEDEQYCGPNRAR